MAGAQDIQRRIKSIKNTKKVTKAMEVVSAAKMKKAVASVLALRPYAQAMQQMFHNVAPHLSEEHPLLAVRDVRGVLVIAIAANKGLCGSFNMQIARVVRAIVENPQNIARVRDAEEVSVSTEDLMVDFVTIGKKADHAVRLAGKDPIATFPDILATPDSAAIQPIIKLIFEKFEDGTYDKVAVVYTDYVNAVTQEQKTRQLLPVSQTDLAKHVAAMDDLSQEEVTLGAHAQHAKDYVIEPSRADVVTALVPRVLESQILHAIFESNASKESARMMAMKNATDAAGEIAQELTLTYNKIRQAKITQEISEISAGCAALEQ